MLATKLQSHVYRSMMAFNCCSRHPPRIASFSPAYLQSFPSRFSNNATHSAQDESHFLLILGPPGGGKGTISKKMLQDFPRFHHISTGDLLREHVAQGTKLGKDADKYMKNGELVPDDLIIALVLEDASPVLEEGKSLLLDGFPRTLKQAIELEKVAHIDTVVNLNIPTETIVARLADRWIHPASGRIYSYSYRPPRVRGRDDETGEELIQREDDKPDTIRKRLEAYAAVTRPLVHFYESRGVAKTFSGTESDVIYPQIKEFLQNRNFL